jgi:hypothetical protein
MYKTASKHTPRGYNAAQNVVHDLAGPSRTRKRRPGGVPIFGGTSQVCPECGQGFGGLKAFQTHLRARHPVKCFDLLSNEQKKLIRAANYKRLKRERRKRKHLTNRSSQPLTGAKTST